MGKNEISPSMLLLPKEHRTRVQKIIGKALTNIERYKYNHKKEYLAFACGLLDSLMYEDDKDETFDKTTN